MMASENLANVTLFGRGGQGGEGSGYLSMQQGVLNKNSGGEGGGVVGVMMQRCRCHSPN